MSDLATLARAAGLRDMDLLDAADRTLPTARAQLEALRAEHPARFAPDARTLAPADYAAARDALVRDETRGRRTRAAAADLARAMANRRAAKD